MDVASNLPWPEEPVVCGYCEGWIGRVPPRSDANLADRTRRPGGLDEENGTANAIPHEGKGRRGAASGQRPRTRLEACPRARHLGPPPVPPPWSDRPGESTSELGTAYSTAAPLAAGLDALRRPHLGLAQAGRATPRGPGLLPGPDSAREAHRDKAATGPPPPFAGSGRPVSRHPLATGPRGLRSQESSTANTLASPNLNSHAGVECGGRAKATAATPEGPRRRLRPRPLRRPRLRRPIFGRPTRAGLVRALPRVLLVIGALLLVEGALTVLWKEPLSALFAARTQSALGDDLERLQRDDAAAAAAAARSQKATARYQSRRAMTLNRETGVSQSIGRLKINKIGLNEVIVQGTDEEVSLKKGPGHYTETPLPGQKGNWTVGIAGHRTTYGAPFRHIDKLEKGDKIVFTAPYGRFTYEATRPGSSTTPTPRHSSRRARTRSC